MENQNFTKNKRKITGGFPTKSTFVIFIICQTISFATIILSLLSFLFWHTEFNKFLSHLTLCITAIILANIPLIMRRRFKLYIPSFLQIIVTLFIFMHFILGEIFRFYDHSMLFDKVLHTTSGVAIAICGFSLVNLLNESPNTHLKLSPFFVALFSFCFALAIGYLWEIFEYVMDSIIGTNMQRWQDGFVSAVIDGEEVMVQLYGQGSGLIDTMGDLIVNTVGAAVISIVGFILLKLKSPKIQNLLIQSFKNPKKTEKEAEEAMQFYQSKKNKKTEDTTKNKLPAENPEELSDSNTNSNKGG